MSRKQQRSAFPASDDDDDEQQYAPPLRRRRWVHDEDELPVEERVMLEHFERHGDAAFGYAAHCENRQCRVTYAVGGGGGGGAGGAGGGGGAGEAGAGAGVGHWRRSIKHDRAFGDDDEDEDDVEVARKRHHAWVDDSAPTRRSMKHDRALFEEAKDSDWEPPAAAKRHHHWLADDEQGAEGLDLPVRVLVDYPTSLKELLPARLDRSMLARRVDDGGGSLRQLDADEFAKLHRIVFDALRKSQQGASSGTLPPVVIERASRSTQPHDVFLTAPSQVATGTTCALFSTVVRQVTWQWLAPVNAAAPVPGSKPLRLAVSLDLVRSRYGVDADVTVVVLLEAHPRAVSETPGALSADAYAQWADAAIALRRAGSRRSLLPLSSGVLMAVPDYSTLALSVALQPVRTADLLATVTNADGTTATVFPHGVFALLSKLPGVLAGMPAFRSVMVHTGSRLDALVYDSDDVSPPCLTAASLLAHNICGEVDRPEFVESVTAQWQLPAGALVPSAANPLAVCVCVSVRTLPGLRLVVHLPAAVVDVNIVSMAAATGAGVSRLLPQAYSAWADAAERMFAGV